MTIHVRNLQKRVKLDTTFLRKVAQTTLDEMRAGEGECSLVLVDDRTIARLNEQYRGVEGPTDVLSFSMREGAFASVAPYLLGDVIISAETADRQAKSAGRALRDELATLLIHGILHLLGHDHQTPLEARAMRRLERRLGGPFLDTRVR
jgi:probable rRNA maturation factor